MKKKLFLTLLLVSLFMCLFVVSVNAGTFGEADTTANIPVGSVITDTKSQIQMSDGKIYPAYYFFNDNTVAKFNFDRVKKADGSSYTKADVVKVEIPEGMEQFEDYNFTQGKCTLLEYVSFPSTLITITRQAFNSCPALTSVTIPDNVKKIGPRAFGACKALTEVIISPTSQLTTIEGSAFQNTAVQSFYFPNSLTTLGSAVFAYNEKGALTTLINFENCAVTKIPSELFRQCTGLKTIKFPKGVTEIEGKNLFTYCDIDTIYLPKTVQKINNAITLKSLKKVVFVAPEETPLPANAPTNVTLEYANYCEVYYNSLHTESDEVVYTYIDENGKPTGVKYLSTLKVTSQCSRGCGEETVIKAIAPLFTCLGYSVSEYGTSGFSVGYAVNNNAIDEYRELTGKTLNYGVFAVLKDKLGENEIFTGDKAADGVLANDFTIRRFDIFEFKITGFTGEQKGTKLAIGAYVIETGKEGTEHTYLQVGTKAENEKYVFVSYNELIK